MTYTVACDADGPAARGPGPDRRATTARTPASGRRSSSAPPATPAAPTGCRTSTSRRAPSTRTTRRRARCAASGSTRRTSPSRGCSTSSPSGSASTAGRSAGGTRSRTGDRFGTGQRLGPGVGLKKTLLAVRDAYRSARYAGIACGAKNTGIGNGLREYGRADPAARGRRDGDAVPLLDGDGPGRAHGLPADRRRRARPPARPDPGRRRHRAASSTPGETTASRATMLGGRAVIEAARSLRTALDGPPARTARRDLAGREFAGEVVVDWTTPHATRDRRAGHPLRVRLGDPGRHPRRRGPDRTGRRRSRRRAGDRTGRCSRVRSRAASTWASARRSARSSSSRAACPSTDTLKSLGHHPCRRDAAGRVHLRRGAAARGTVRRQGDGRGRARADRGRGRRGAVPVRRDPQDEPADARLRGRPGGGPAAGPATPGARTPERKSR